MPSIRIERPSIHQIETPEQALERVRARIKGIKKIPDYKKFGSGYINAVLELNRLRAQLEFSHKTYARSAPLECRREIVFLGMRHDAPAKRFFLALPIEANRNRLKPSQSSRDVWVGSTLLPTFRHSRKAKA